MPINSKKNDVNQGENIAYLRLRYRLTQQQLADKVGMHQTDISDLEKKEVIGENILEKIANALEVPLKFIKEFDMGEAINSHTSLYIESIHQNHSDNSSGNENIIHKSVEQATIFPLETVKDLYERLLQKEQSEVESLKSQIADLKKELAEAKTR